MRACFLQFRLALCLALALAWVGPAMAAKHFDRHGNEGYDTAAECDAAVRSGKAKFYQSFTHEPPLLRAGEASVKVMALADVKIPPEVVKSQAYGADNYRQGACDMGVPRKDRRDGVSKPLVGKYIPFAPGMRVNVYFDKAGNPLRVSMQQCDNWYSHNFPRPIPQEQPFQCPPDGQPAPPAPPLPDFIKPEPTTTK